MIYLVKYSITRNPKYAGWVKTKGQFLEWLRQHNVERIRRNEVSEYATEFELIELQELTGEINWM